MKTLLKTTAIALALVMLMLAAVPAAPTITASAATSPSALEIAQIIPEIYEFGLGDRTVRVDSDFSFDTSVNSNIPDKIESLSIQVEIPSEFELMQGILNPGAAALGRNYSYRVYVPSDVSAKTYFIRNTVTYSYQYIDAATAAREGLTDASTADEVAAKTTTKTDSKNFSMSVVVYDNKTVSSAPLAISGFAAPSSVAAESPFDISLSLVNQGGEDYKNAQVTLYNGTETLQTVFVGTVAANSAEAVKLENVVFKTAGTASCRVVATYLNTQGNSASTQRSFTVTVTSRSQLEISQISPPSKIEVGEECEIEFTLVNRGVTDFKNAQVYLTKDGRQLKNTYVGTVEAQSSADGVVKYTFTPEQVVGKYTLKVTYENAVGKKLSAERGFTPSFETGNDDSGALRIQSIVPPFEELIRTATEVEFWITNPSANKIKGAEVFLYDEKGKELNSLYISEMEANSTEAYSLAFFTPASEGVYSYTLRLNYRNADGASNTIRKSYSINVVTEKEDPEDTGKPSNVRIQKIEAPAIMYAGVSSKVEVSLANAGKGTAYNVEFYIIDSSGKELAREFVGNIESSASQKIETTLKFTEPVEAELTLFVDFENADGSTGAGAKAFSQTVIDYRASITDIPDSSNMYIVAGEPATIEFSVLNNGTEEMLNVNAVLLDSKGKKYSECFIGKIDPSQKKERQRFRDVIFEEAGTLELTIEVSFENNDMSQLSFSSDFTVTVNEPYVPEPQPEEGGEGGEGGYDEGQDVSGEGGGVAWWIFALIGGGVIVIAGIVVLIIFLRKRSLEKESDEMEQFIKLMAGGAEAEKTADKETE